MDCSNLTLYEVDSLLQAVCVLVAIVQNVNAEFKRQKILFVVDSVHCIQHGFQCLNSTL